MDITIRPARTEDAAAISRLVQDTLTASNTSDYPPAEIARIVLAFAEPAFRALMQRRTTFVACRGAEIVGTAGLEGQTVRTMFVLPPEQGHGIGRRLIAAVEALATNQGIARLEVQSSLTAVPFYARCGYRTLREALYGAERTVIMEKTLSGHRV